jgi:nuclear GTP-binding protein
MKKILKGSKKSKRISTHSRQVITQRVKQHKRKTKKEAKKLSSAGFRKSGKTSNQNSDLPNLMPLKKKIIQSLAAKKQSSLRDSAINNLTQKTIVTINQSVVQEDPAVREQKFIDDMAAKNAPKAGPRMKHNYMKELKEVIESSDIILEVLDARDPEGCRCREMEAEILSKSGDKRIILVLNKIDLVPIEVVQLWKKKLSREYACVLFKSNTQGQTKDFGQTKLFNSSVKDKKAMVTELLTSSKSVGPDKLLELIKNYSKTEGIKTAVAVGVIGFPNVGKSSLINSMKKRRAVGVSATAGYTKNLQEVEIDSKVKIIDSPGVILSKEDEVTLVLRNQINASEVKDPITPIERMLNMISKDDLLLQYKIADFKDAKGFLLNVAKSRGKYIKGGIPNLEEAARIVIGDWSHGKLKYYSIPDGYKGPGTGGMDDEIKDFHNELIYINQQEDDEMCEE